MIEVEVKLKIEEKGYEDIIRQLGFAQVSYMLEEDVYYTGKQMDMRKEDKALRIRREQDLDTGETSYTLNFKGPKLDTVSMTREETEFSIPSFDQGDMLLKGLGFYAAGRVEKRRRVFQKSNISCLFDEVTDLGVFLEIEILAQKQEYDRAMEEINMLLAKMGLQLQDTINVSYLSMLEEKRKFSSK